MVILEYMAKGIPVISFDCQEGPGILLRDNTGLLLPPEDTIKLSEAIVTMTEDKSLRIYYAQKGLLRAEEYLPSKILNKWECLISESLE